MTKLEEIRKRKGFSGYELAARSGVSESNISRIEHGLINPANIKVGTLYKLSQALNVTLDDLIDYSSLKGI